VVVLALHVGAAALLLSPSREPMESTLGEVINIDLVPDFSTDAEKPDEVAGPEVTESLADPTAQHAEDPEPPALNSLGPAEADEAKPAAPDLTAPLAPVAGEVAVDRPAEEPVSEPKPKNPHEVKPNVAEKAPESRDTVQSRASAGSAGLLGGGRRPSAAAQATWRGAIGQHLVKFRRYPAEARNGHQQGVATVRVTIGGDGHVLGRELLKSSGHRLLDREAVEMMGRSDPFPKPPPGVPTPVVLNVPVNFTIR